MHIIVADLYGSDRMNLRTKLACWLWPFEGLFQTTASAAFCTSLSA